MLEGRVINSFLLLSVTDDPGTTGWVAGRPFLVVLWSELGEGDVSAEVLRP